jgi:inosine-uridine nucleoside N-ribohydrolase
MKIDWAKYRLFLHGIISTFVGAALTTLASVVVSPDLSYQQLLKVAVMGGLVGTAGYFTKSPVKQ